jgi:Ca2+-binding RTX toxin-like protein
LKRVIALQAVTVVLVALTATTTAIPQESVTMVDCMTDDPCIGTSGNDTINGSDRQDVIYGLAGDDVVDPGADQAPDYVFCGTGFDTVDQMPRVIPDDLQYQQDALQYASEPDVIADDCEERAL